MASMMARSAFGMRVVALMMVSSVWRRRNSTPRSSRVNQATLRPSSTACWPRNVLPVPDRKVPRYSRWARRSPCSDRVSEGGTVSLNGHVSLHLDYGQASASAEEVRMQTLDDLVAPFGITVGEFVEQLQAEL